MCARFQKPSPYRKEIERGLLIFDLDGTLLDTLEDLWASVNHALAQFSLPLRSMCEVRQFLGYGARVLVQRAMPDDCPKELAEPVYAAFREYYLQHSNDRTRPYPGILEILQECKRRGYATAIVSNKPDAAVQQLHQRFFANTIDVAIGEQQPTIRRKPAPDMVFAAIEQLQFPKITPSSLNTPLPIGEGSGERLFYIGDSEVDIATAQAASIPCICVDWGFRDRHFLEQQGATHIIHTPEELLTLLDEI